MSESLAEVGVPEAAVEAAPEAVDPLAAGMGAGDVATDDQVEEPVAAAEPAAPAFDPRDAELEHLRTQNEEVLSALNQLVESGALGGAPQAQAQPQDPMAAIAAQLVDEYGQVNPAALAQFLTTQSQAQVAAIGQQLAPLVQALQGQQEDAVQARGQENLQGMLDDHVARHGEFASTPEADAAARGRVFERAEAMWPEIQAKYGHNPRAAEIALDLAAQHERAYINSIRGEGAAEHANRMATLAGAAADVGPGAPGGITGSEEFKSVGDVLRHWAPKLREA